MNPWELLSDRHLIEYLEAETVNDIDKRPILHRRMAAEWPANG
ncbi:MAG: hypothetical protein Kow00111_09030 [Thermincola ferriacetica]